MKKTIKRIWNAVTSLMVGILVLLAALLWGCKLIGMDAFVVQSGSMEPACPVGALVYVQPVEASQLSTGDVITFELGGGVRGTHRIVEVLEENGSLAFRTKGDANEEADNTPVLPKDIVGRVVFTIPLLGFLAVYIQQPPGLYVTISVVAVVLLLTILPDILFPEEKTKTKQEETE